MKSNLSHITFFAILVFLIPGSIAAQFLNIQLDVEPEVETLVEQPLNFGEVITNSGRQVINLGDANMGIFRINALNAQHLILQLQSDEQLVHADEEIEQTIPIEIEASFTNNGENDYRISTPLDQNFSDITIEAPPQSPESVWSAMYLYIYGNITIGDVPAGTYRGEIILTVIYE